MTGGRPLVVAIDGPAGSGKSTVAAALAQRLSVPHVDTGAHYRAAALAVLRSGVNPADSGACTAVLAGVRIQRRDGRTLLDGVDVEDEIRGPDVTGVVSTVSAHPEVRRALLAGQRAEVTSAGAVVEGRDAGTVIVPDAALKVWLTAAPEERARRRASQRGRSDEATVARHQVDLLRRDEADAASMVPAPDVVEIDTSGRSVVSLVEELADLATRAAAGAPRPVEER